MIKYLKAINRTLIDKLIRRTVRTNNYNIENDQSDRDDYVKKESDLINVTLYKISVKQLKNQLNPIITYSNYRKSFNKTLARMYKEQVNKVKKKDESSFYS